MADLRRAVSRALRFPWYPFLVGALPAVHFHEANFRLLQTADLVRPVLLPWALVAALLAAGRLVWRSSANAAVVLTPFLVVVFKGADLGGALSVGALLATLVLGLVLGRGHATWPAQLAPAGNAVLVVLVLLPLANVWRADRQEQSPQPSAFFQSEIPLADDVAAAAKPDIYFLMVDGLGEPAYVESRYPLDEADYSEPFEARGFQVLRSSLANYTQTALSSAATLNLGPMGQVLDIDDRTSRDRRVLEQVNGDSRVVRALRRLGYRIVEYPSGYPLTRLAEPDSRHTPPLDPSFAEYYLLEDGVLPLLLPLLGRGPADVSFALRRGRLDFIFDELPDARRGVPGTSPIFVYAHILAPHPPFVFGPNGEARRSRATFAFADGNHWLNIHGRQDKSYRQRYADQATWIVHRLASAVDAILAASDRPKVIIIQGDHGPGSGLEWERPRKTDLNERFGIFNAWYASDGRSLPVYEGMTALNTFPVLFNSLFGADLALLPDRYWFAPMSQPYIYLEMVSDRDR